MECVGEDSKNLPLLRKKTAFHVQFTPTDCISRTVRCNYIAIAIESISRTLFTLQSGFNLMLQMGYTVGSIISYMSHKIDNK